MANLITGDKIRQNNLDYFEPDTIESCDVKITNYCAGAGNMVNGVDNRGGCPFCHEGS